MYPAVSPATRKMSSIRWCSDSTKRKGIVIMSPRNSASSTPFQTTHRFLFSMDLLKRDEMICTGARIEAIAE